MQTKKKKKYSSSGVCLIATSVCCFVPGQQCHGLWLGNICAMSSPPAPGPRDTICYCPSKGSFSLLRWLPFLFLHVHSSVLSLAPPLPSKCLPHWKCPLSAPASPGIHLCFPNISHQTSYIWIPSGDLLRADSSSHCTLQDQTLQEVKPGICILASSPGDSDGARPGNLWYRLLPNLYLQPVSLS